MNTIKCNYVTPIVCLWNVKVIIFSLLIIGSLSDITEQPKYAAKNFTNEERFGDQYIHNDRNTDILNDFTRSELFEYKFDLPRLKSVLVPDILDSLKHTIGKVFVKFNTTLVHTGQIVQPRDMKCPPTLYWVPTPGSLYSVIIIDLDSPSNARPIDREYVVWILLNVFESRYKAGYVLEGYLRPKPCKGTGLHRYVVLVYQQKKWIIVSRSYANEIRRNRKRFCTMEFANTFDLASLVGGNYWLSEWDPSVGYLT